MNKMNYETILTELNNEMLEITFNRAQKNNSLSEQLITETLEAIEAIEQDEKIKTIVIQGREGVFCTGMDFEQVTKVIMTENNTSLENDSYMRLLKKISSIDKMVIGKVDGKVLAGGMGIVAACDIVLQPQDHNLDYRKQCGVYCPLMLCLT